MRFFSFLRDWTARRQRPSAVVEFDEDAVTCTRRNGVVERVRWVELRAVLIQTTSDGPWVDDMFWVLVGKDGGCVVPSEAVGCRQLMERLQQLPGFDNDAVIEAVKLTEDQTLLCWHRPDAGDSRDAGQD